MFPYPSSHGNLANHIGLKEQHTPRSEGRKGLKLKLG